MIISNTQTVPGRQIVEFYGIVTGSTVRAKHIGRDLMAGLKNVVGGELRGYTELLEESRQEARIIVPPATAGGEETEEEGGVEGDEEDADSERRVLHRVTRVLHTPTAWCCWLVVDTRYRPDRGTPVLYRLFQI